MERFARTTIGYSTLSAAIFRGDLKYSACQRSSRLRTSHRPTSTATFLRLYPDPGSGSDTSTIAASHSWAWPLGVRSGSAPDRSASPRGKFAPPRGLGNENVTRPLDENRLSLGGGVVGDQSSGRRRS